MSAFLNSDYECECIEYEHFQKNRVQKKIVDVLFIKKWMKLLKWMDFIYWLSKFGILSSTY